MKPGVVDWSVVAVMIAASLFEWQWYRPRYIRAIRTNVRGARVRMYRSLVVAEWVVTLWVLALWVAKARSWSGLWLVPHGQLRLGVGLVLAAVLIGLLASQTKRILAQPKLRAKVRENILFIDPLIPRTSGERHAFWFVSITAGICEEILFRGFLIWLIAAWTGLLLAIVISSIFFGFGHVYLGWAQRPRTGVVGLVLAILVVATRSLWPAIAIHAALDLNSGELGFCVGRPPAA
jgi:uncharacterized protein